MILKRVELWNYRTHAHTVIDFREGIVGVLGPNEVGKSAIFEAVAWCIFGSKAIRSKMERVRWRGASERNPARGEVTFSVGAALYKVYRSEDGASLFVWRDELHLDGGEWSKIAATRSAVEKRAPEVVGMSLDEFWAVYLAGQKDLDRLEKMKPTERQGFFLEVLGVGAIDRAIEWCRKDKNFASSEAARATAKLGHREPLARAHDDAFEALQLASAEAQRFGVLLDASRASFTAATEAYRAAAERGVAWGKVADARKEAEFATREAAQVFAQSVRDRQESERASLEISEEDVSAALTAARGKADELTEKAQKARRIAQILAHITEAKTELAIHRERADLLAALVGAYDADAHDRALSAFTAANAAFLDAKEAAAADRARLASQREQAVERLQLIESRVESLERLGPNAACHTCSRPLAEVYEKVMVDLSEEWQELRKVIDTSEPIDEPEIPQLRRALEDAGHAVREFDRQRMGAERATKDVALARAEQERYAARVVTIGAELAGVYNDDDEGLAAMIDEPQVHANAWNATADSLWDESDLWKGTRNELEGRYNEYMHARVIADRLPVRLEAELAARAAAELASAEVDRLNRELGSMAYDPEVTARLRAAEEAACALLDQHEQRARHAESVVVNAKYREARLVAELTAYDQEAELVAQARAKAVLLEECERRLLDFRGQEVGAIRPNLEALASGIIALLTDGRHEGVKVTEDYAIVLLEGGHEEHDASGGASDLRSVALRIALAEMVAQRAGSPLEGLWLDEPFGYLDDTRRQNLMGLLRRLLAEFRQVILISHFPDTRDGVDQAVAFSFDEARGCAMLTGSS